MSRRTHLRRALLATCLSAVGADAGNTRIIPGSTLFSAGLGWLISRYELSFGVDNLFDHGNWHYGAGTGGGAEPGPGPYGVRPHRGEVLNVVRKQIGAHGEFSVRADCVSGYRDQCCLTFSTGDFGCTWRSRST